MHGTEIGGRMVSRNLSRAGPSLTSTQIDVHYSLPRADEQSGRCDREKNQVSSPKCRSESDSPSARAPSWSASDTRGY